MYTIANSATNVKGIIEHFQFVHILYLHMYFFQIDSIFPIWPIENSINLCFYFYFHSECNTFFLDKCLQAQLSGIDNLFNGDKWKTSFLYEMKEMVFVLLSFPILSETSICICVTAGMHTDSCKYLYSQPSFHSFYNFHKPTF